MADPTVRTDLAAAIDTAVEPLEDAGWSIAVYPVWVDQVTVPAVIVDDFGFNQPDPRSLPNLTATVRVLLPDRPPEARAVLGDALFEAMAGLEVPEHGLRCASITPGATLIADTTHPGYVVSMAGGIRTLCGIAPEPIPPPVPRVTLTIDSVEDLTVTVTVGNTDPDAPPASVDWGDSYETTELTHTYESAGTYSVVGRQYGRRDSLPKSVTVTAPPPPQLVLIVTDQTDLTVTIDVTADDPELPVSITWGDGTTATDVYAHTYGAAGTYNIGATQPGRIDAIPVPVTVTEPPPPPQLTLTVDTVDDLEVSVTVGNTDLAGDPATVDWGDGSVTVELDHTYVDPGTYELIAEQVGRVDSTPVDVTVTAPPEVGPFPGTSGGFYENWNNPLVTTVPSAGTEAGQAFAWLVVTTPTPPTNAGSPDVVARSPAWFTAHGITRVRADMGLATVLDRPAGSFIAVADFAGCQPRDCNNGLALPAGNHTITVDMFDAADTLVARYTTPITVT